MGNFTYNGWNYRECRCAHIFKLRMQTKRLLIKLLVIFTILFNSVFEFKIWIITNSTSNS